MLTYEEKRVRLILSLPVCVCMFLYAYEPQACAGQGAVHMRACDVNVCVFVSFDS